MALRIEKLDGANCPLRAWNTIIYKKDGKWMSTSTGSNPDGSKIVGNAVINISDDGKTHRMAGSTTVGGKKVDDLRDVWRRVGK